MDAAEAARLARGALDALATAYPHKLDHVILREGDHPSPARIHPVFHGCYDWHSSVHMHWSLLRLRARLPEGDARSDIERHFDGRFTRELVDRERAYAAEPGRGAFERPYGWAWLLKLQAELAEQAQRSGAPVSAWADALMPFATDIAARFVEFLPRGAYPVRAGMHANSAFAMVLARDYATRCRDARLLAVIDGVARAWFGGDDGYDSRYEPGGADFLSGGLCEALLMSRVLGDGFGAWWARFDRDGAAMRHWLVPVTVGDRADPQLVHLEGLNLSRAWCLRELSSRVPHSQRETLLAAVQDHVKAGSVHVMEGDFVATHWLLTFAILAADEAKAG